jgi:dTDP-4-dehydrorhamnose reductase
MNKKLLILGRGFIGKRLQDQWRCDFSERKIFTFMDAEEEIKKFKPDIIVNCIGHTGEKNIDGCEEDKDRTLTSNAFVPLILAEVALRNNIKLVHVSSGCIFNFDYAKDDPIDEDRIPDYFELFYSRTKIYSEQALKILSKKYPILIVRIRVPLDNIPHSRNILTKLIEYKKINDIPNSITYIPDFIKALEHLIQVEACGIYNVVTKGALNYPDLMAHYKKFVPEFEYQVVDFSTLNLKRTNLIMSAEKLEKSGFKVRNTKEILDECVKEYLKH